MKILALGDVVGEPGRRLVEAFLPDLRRETGADLVVVNGENAAHGHTRERLGEAAKPRALRCGILCTKEGGYAIL